MRMAVKLHELKLPAGPTKYPAEEVMRACAALAGAPGRALSRPGSRSSSAHSRGKLPSYVQPSYVPSLVHVMPSLSPLQLRSPINKQTGSNQLSVMPAGGARGILMARRAGMPLPRTRPVLHHHVPQRASIVGRRSVDAAGRVNVAMVGANRPLPRDSVRSALYPWA